MRFGSSSQKVGIAFLCAITGVQADTQADTEVEEVVVSGTRTPKSLVDSPVSIDVISGVQLKKVTQSTLGRALNFMPGVVAKRNQKDGYIVFLQGYSANRVLVLLNGQPLITPTGSEVDLDQISVADIERIEIMRGAGSALYGSAAMGGVINIITNKNYKESLSFNTQVSSYVGNEIEGDEYGHQFRLQGRGAKEDLFASFSLQQIDDPGFDYAPEVVLQDGVSMHKQFIRGEVGYEFKPLVASYQGQLLDEERKKAIFDRLVFPPGELRRFYYLSELEQQQHNFSLRDNSEVANSPEWQVNLRHSIHDEISGNMPSLREANIVGSHFDGQKVWMGKNQEVVGGLSSSLFEMEQRKVETDTVVNDAQSEAEIPDESTENYEVFLQYNRFDTTWDWLIGGRYQNDTKFNDHSALRFSGMKKFDSPLGTWYLRSGVGQSYRVPNIKELYYFFDHSNLGYMILGNEALKPETAISGNASLGLNKMSTSYHGGLKVELNFHYSEAENLISTLLSPELSRQSGDSEIPIDIFTYENFSKTQIYGFDLTFDISWKIGQLQLNYSYLEAKDTEEDKRLPDRPRHQLKTSFSHSFSEAFNIVVYGLHERDEEAPAGYSIGKNETSTLNFTINHQFNRRLQWQFGIDNLFDERRESSSTENAIFDIRPVSSRQVFLGLTLEIL